MKSCVITITVTDEEGNVHTVEEVIQVMAGDRGKKPEEPAEPKA
jgi:hypothetical protein